MIPHDVHSPEDLDDLLTTIGTQGIMCWRDPKPPSSALDKKFDEDEAGEDVELYLTPGALEMTTTPSECISAKWERSAAHPRRRSRNRQAHRAWTTSLLLKALSRSPIVINELLAMGEHLKKGVRFIKEVVTFDEEEITDEILQNRLKEFTGKIDDLAKAYKKANHLLEKFAAVSQKKRQGTIAAIASPWRVPLLRSLSCVRKLGFTNTERKRLIDRANKTVDMMRSLDRQILEPGEKGGCDPQRRAAQGIPAPVACHPH